VVVGNQDGRGGQPTYDIRERLKASGYRWNQSDWPGWSKILSATELDGQNWPESVWLSEADGIEIKVLDDTGRTVARYFVDHGRLSEDFNEVTRS
jgi:DNA helicase IV